MSAAPARRRILVAFDASAGSRAALEAAAGFALPLEADIEGLFVEDVNLLRLAGLPFARAFAAGGERRLDEVTMRKALRVQAENAERAIAALARELGVPWRFRSVRGNVRAELLAASAGVECIALGTFGERLTHTQLGSTVRAMLKATDRSLLLAAPGTRRLGPVACLFDGMPVAARALDRAARLAASTTRQVTVLLAVGDPAEAARQRRAAEKRLAGLGLDVRYRRVPVADGESLAAAIQAGDPATLVLARPTGMPDADFQALLARLAGIVWLTGDAEPTNP